MDVAVESEIGTSNSALIFSKYVMMLRKLRPGLTAPEIRYLILKTCTKEIFLPDGGIFDFEAAKKAVLDFDFYAKQSATEEPFQSTLGRCV